MATLSAQITATGISAPDYDDILQQLKSAFQSIYGSDIDLAPDTQDGQIIAIFARAINDCNQMAIATYNAYSPATAQGAGLASVVKINGLQKKLSSNSTAPVTVVGVAGTTIEGGIIGDNAGLGTQWRLPSPLLIPAEGTIDTTATCTQTGAITAQENTLTVIVTPTLGWQSVTNPETAAPGAPVEQDAQLRARQSESTANGAETVIEALYGAVAEIPLVQQVQIYENDADAPDANGVPAHSIAVVVLGGDAQAILQTIAAKKSPGTGTAGTSSAVIVDSKGVPNTYRYYPMTEESIYATVTVVPLTGYSNVVGQKIQQALSDWINSLAMGETVFYGKLWGAANLFGDPDTEKFNVSAITVGTAPNPVGTVDVPIVFTSRAFCTPGNINIVVV